MRDTGDIGWMGSWRALALVVGVTLAALALPRLLPPLTAAENRGEDGLIAWLTPAAPQHPGIAIIAVTEDTLAVLPYRSPIDRGFLATVMVSLLRAEVRAIGLDILLDQPTEPGKDAALREAMLAAGSRLVAITAAPDTPLTEDQRRFLDSYLLGLPLGYANLAKDRIDGTVRRHLPRLAAEAGGDRDSFPVMLARAAGATDLPTEPFEIAWHGRPDAATPPFPVYPAHAVPFLPRDWLAGRIILIGAVISDGDRHRTPPASAGPPMPGVEIQAHVLAQILDHRTPPRVPFWLGAVLTATLAALGLAVARSGRPPWVQGLACAAVLALLWSGAAALYHAGGPLLPTLAPSLAWLGALGLVAITQVLRERADRAVLMRLFANHVSQPVAEDIWRQRRTFLAGGRPRPQQVVATVLFSDIEDSTGIAERLGPEALMVWLEGYMDAMVHVVTEHDGIVLRFIGDGILAVFGVPVARTTEAGIDHDALQAVRCALAMEHALERLNQRWRTEGLPPVCIRVGIVTGPMVAGSLGGLRHMEYSLIGDTVNTAARLEAYAKQVTAAGPCRILVGESTWSRVAGAFTAELVGEIELKGKQNRVRVYRVLGDG